MAQVGTLGYIWVYLGTFDDQTFPLNYLPLLSWSAILAKVVQVAVGGGVSLGEQQNLCGDYIFSGHTMILAVSYLTVRDCQFTS